MVSPTASAQDLVNLVDKVQDIIAYVDSYVRLLALSSTF